jgi:hypothetical protein
LIINKAPVTGTNVSRTARKAKSKVLGMTHTTKYDTTASQLNISLAHETSVDKSLISKYDATENHVSTGIPTTVLKSCESSKMGSKILITHENLTHFHMPQVIKNTDCDKPCIDRVTKSVGTGKETPSTRSKNFICT